LATPYFQLRYDRVASTQDLAREKIDDLPLLVIAASQTSGRGRSGSEWENADRALAASLALRSGREDQRPFSLMAGVAAVRALPDVSLKWPNDVLRENLKVGGILTERSGDVTVVGLGVNLWWPEAPAGVGALFDDDPGEERHAELSALWGAELMEIFDGEGWPFEDYRASCRTIGQSIRWDPDGVGTARDVNQDGALIVITDAGEETLYSGAVRHVRTDR
jgi:BirA family biotin operon repressor/biotin-[acetyl-CoA-carboxylase] ligase